MRLKFFISKYQNCFISVFVLVNWWMFLSFCFRISSEAEVMSFPKPSTRGQYCVDVRWLESAVFELIREMTIDTVVYVEDLCKKRQKIINASMILKKLIFKVAVSIQKEHQKMFNFEFLFISQKESNILIISVQFPFENWSFF